METEIEKEIALLEAEVGEMTRQKEDYERQIREMRERENLREGVVLAREIFETQREKLRIEVDIQFRRNRINRLRLEARPGGF